MRFFDLAAHMLPANPAHGFSMADSWVWCGSAIRGDDGKYHMFAARWSRERPFFSGYVVSSEIVRAVADSPEGPYTYAETVLPDRGADFWDGRMTHNPSIIQFGGIYYLFYIGATYEGPRPSGETLATRRPACIDQAYDTIRIGLATAKSVLGPWRRLDRPILDICAGAWDQHVVTNPTACFLPNGEIYLYYRSNTPQGLRIGVARGHVGDLRFSRIGAEPILADHPEWVIEDPFVWHNGENFEMIAKDIRGNISGEVWGGAHFLSANGLDWQLAPTPKAYSRTVRWKSGAEEQLFHFERPSLLIENGVPRCLFAAMGRDGGTLFPFEPKNFNGMSLAKNMVIPLLPISVGDVSGQCR